MPDCDYCSLKHNGVYGSGRFCNASCARGFSTRVARLEINAKVSAALSGRPTGHGFTAETRYPWTPARRKKLAATQVARMRTRFQEMSWDELPRRQKKRRVLQEQRGACLCGIVNWRDEPIRMEFHHADGNSNNDARENVSMLCPNCHSQTPTYRSNNDRRKKLGLPTRSEARAIKSRGHVADVGSGPALVTQ